MKTAIIYNSKYGSTEAYAKWLANDLGCDIVEATAHTAQLLQKYHCIIFGGNVRMGKISNTKWLVKNYAALKDKQMALFAVGASPSDPKIVGEIRKQSLGEELRELQEQQELHEQQELPFFYLRGAIRLDNMAWLDKKMLSFVGKAVTAKSEAERTELDRVIVDALAKPNGSSTNWIDKKQLAPIIAWAQAAS